MRVVRQPSGFPRRQLSPVVRHPRSPRRTGSNSSHARRHRTTSRRRPRGRSRMTRPQSAPDKASRTAERLVTTHARRPAAAVARAAGERSGGCRVRLDGGYARRLASIRQRVVVIHHSTQCGHDGVACADEQLGVATLLYVRIASCKYVDWHGGSCAEGHATNFLALPRAHATMCLFTHALTYRPSQERPRRARE